MNRPSIVAAAGLAAALALAISLPGCKTAGSPAPRNPEGAAAAPQSPAPATAPDSSASLSAPSPKAAPAKSARLPEPSAIGPDTEGFWPAPESRIRELSISMRIGDEALLRSWKVEIAPVAGGRAAKSYVGSAGDVPEKLSWDGRGPDGKLAREGLYAAVLRVEYVEGLAPASLSSKPFALALSGPEPVLYANPPRLEPSPEGVKRPLSFELAARPALARLDSWRLDILGPDGRVFRAFEGEWPETGAPSPIDWDGLSDSGAAVTAGKRYTGILSVRDAYGHLASAQASVAVADLPYAPERSSVQPWTSGFSPNGDKVMDAMDLSLAFGQRAAIRSWRLEISQAEKGLVRAFRGSAPDLPSSISWDGKDSSGAPAPEGRYAATLSVDYGSTFSPAVARSPSFVLDVTPPQLSLSATPKLFAPLLGNPGPAAADTSLSIRLGAASALGRVSDWSVEVLDPGGRVFARFGGAWPAAAISWDGLGTDGSLVESAETYRLVARVRDEFGNSSQTESSFDTDILVIKEGDRYRVAVASIVFKGYTSDYEDLPADQVAQNRLTLDRLAAKFARFPDYRIRLVGHAVMINWDDPNLGKGEQEKILIPLSRSRAAAIAKALAARGIPASRMTAEGLGATKPLVPDSDLANRWKNRRVEFYLEK